MIRQSVGCIEFLKWITELKRKCDSSACETLTLDLP